MGQEISRHYNQFATQFNQVTRDQELSEPEQQALGQQIEKIQDPNLNTLARTYVDQARIQTATGTRIPHIALMKDSTLEIDMHFKAGRDKIVPTGTIHLKQEMMQQLIEKLLTTSLNMTDVSFRFDPASSSY
ncbi:MAG: hypothetical protein CVV27_19455, partial [Candidatus Melainabacteria bacterium HGW-Melainabacteria-1]